MPHYWLYMLMNHSILFPALAGLARWSAAPREYRPWIILLWLGAVNETLSLLMAHIIHSNAANSNLYVLLEFYFLLWQFKLWNRAQPSPYIIFAGLGLAVWVLDNLVLNSLGDDNSIYRACYAAVLAGFALDRLNRLAVFEKRGLLKNPQFLACTAFLLYYGCKVFAETMNAFRVSLGDVFYMHLWLTLSFVNCASNIMYGTAVLCIPKRQEFTWPY